MKLAKEDKSITILPLLQEKFDAPQEAPSNILISSTVFNLFIWFKLQKQDSCVTILPAMPQINVFRASEVWHSNLDFSPSFYQSKMCIIYSMSSVLKSATNKGFPNMHIRYYQAIWILAPNAACSLVTFNCPSQYSQSLVRIQHLESLKKETDYWVSPSPALAKLPFKCSVT